MAPETPKKHSIQRMARRKGHRFEREIANLLKPLYPHARRHLEYHKDDAALGIDIINTGEFKIQCKRGREYAPINRIEEVKIDVIEGGTPVLMTKGDEKRIVVCLYMDDFLRILERQNNHG